MNMVWYVLLLFSSMHLVALSPGALNERGRAAKKPKLVSLKKKGKKEQASPFAVQKEQEKDARLKTQFHQSLPNEEDAQEAYKQMKKHMKPAQQSLNGLTMSQMNFDQLLMRKNELIVMGDYQTAIKYVQRMLTLSETSAQQVYIMMELGELYMKTGDYRRAEIAFVDFAKLYPSNEFVEQAFVKAIECSWMQTPQFDRDQTKTEETLSLINEFAQREAIFGQQSIEKVKDIQHKCMLKLVDQKLDIARQYINRNAFRSAHKRLADIRTVDMPKLPELEPIVLQLEFDLAVAEDTEAIALLKKEELLKKYPEHEITIALTNEKSSWFSWLQPKASPRVELS